MNIDKLTSEEKKFPLRTLAGNGKKEEEKWVNGGKGKW